MKTTEQCENCGTEYDAAQPLCDDYNGCEHDWVVSHMTARDGTTFVRRRCKECGREEMVEQ